MEEKWEKKFDLKFSFTGEKNIELLTPRGAWTNGKTLIVSDTGNNRMLIWNDFQYDNFQEPTCCIGQENLNVITKSILPNAHTVQYPSAVWSDGKKMIVADAWNHRVLIWHTIPTKNNQNADVVIGQENFETILPNQKGVGTAPKPNSLYWCYGVWSDGKALWIADTGNRRVLYFDNIPTKNNANADRVVGQENFYEKDLNPATATWPYAVKISPNGAMAIVDTQYFRILLWKNWEDALQQKPPIIIGQENIAANGQNQYRLKPARNSLNWCYDACFYKNGIAIADTGNSRILVWDALPIQNNQAATTLIGQENFEINGESSLSLTAKIKNEIYWPFAVNSFFEDLIISDTGNNRILFYTPNRSFL